MVFSEADPRYKYKRPEPGWKRFRVSDLRTLLANRGRIQAVRPENGNNEDLVFNQEATQFQNLLRAGPHTPELEPEIVEHNNNTAGAKKKSKSAARRRDRRNKLKSSRSESNNAENNSNNTINEPNSSGITSKRQLEAPFPPKTGDEKVRIIKKKEESDMADNKPRDEVLAARQAKKLAKQKGKGNESEVKATPVKEIPKPVKTSPPKGKDEVDKACVKVDTVTADDKNKELIKAERAAKKAEKQAKKKGNEGERIISKKTADQFRPTTEYKLIIEPMTVQDVAETLRDIVCVAKEMKDVTEKVSALDLSGRKEIKEKPDESGKSKAELRAERRAKQEAQRAAKQAAQEQKVVAKPQETKATPDRDTPSKETKAPKQKTAEKSKAKPQSSNRLNWFPDLYKEHDKESLKNIPINSHLHPAIIKLGVQLATRVVTGSNARCIALLDALKKMVRDYTLPAKTEFARGLESHLASSLEYLWSMRPPSASQTNAVKFFRYHLTQMPNNIDEFDAKKTLQEEIDRYIREQIDMAGEAISIAVRNKISKGDNILTYGYSSLIERILREAWSAGAQFHVVVAGARHSGAAPQMLRRLTAHGLPCTYVDITALSSIMHTINKVVLGAGALLVNGSVLGALGTAQVALAARARNVPVLVACETHKFSERVQTDAFVYNELGDPDDFIDKSDENSPLKDWRSNPNLTPLNLTYDVTPASLVTAVVTELAILPCTSAPVVLRFKLSEYGI
ncbi:eukaryotic translation initiation factor 2B subunit delta isoform X2 [Anticarsia gemmatalis]|uniref:eukaryotic translation initiation factor 2B subunit delta isoform X2 n=1 Tax=Anticarsia gemmatalis TaxID=129554 RepID=UPI003F7581AC